MKFNLFEFDLIESKLFSFFCSILKYLFLAESKSFINNAFFLILLFSFVSEIILKNGCCLSGFELLYALKFELFDTEVTLLFITIFLFDEKGLIETL